MTQQAGQTKGSSWKNRYCLKSGPDWPTA